VLGGMKQRWRDRDDSPRRNFLGINIYLSLFPGLAIMLTVLGFNVLGDGLRDLLDTRS